MKIPSSAPVLIAALTHATAQAAVLSTSDNFSSDTSANYSTTGGFAHAYSAIGSTDFGDGANDGYLGVTVPGSNVTGVLAYSLGAVEAGDVGKQLSLVFRLDGRGFNFHGSNVSFTSNSVAIGSTTVGTTTFPEWNTEGTALATPAATLGDWRQKNGVGSLSYTIQAADVGKTLGWQFASTSTSSGGYSFGIDNWSVNVIPEPSVMVLSTLGVIGLITRRRR